MCSRLIILRCSRLRFSQVFSVEVFIGVVLKCLLLFSCFLECSRLMFYSDWLRNSRQSAYIARAHMDGTNIKKIREHQLGWPNGLSIDYGGNRLYWADAFFDR